METQKIIVEFPYPVTLTRRIPRKMQDIIEEIIEDNDPKSLWLEEGGSQLLSYPLTKEQEEAGQGLEFDHNVLYYKVNSTIDKNCVAIPRKVRKRLLRLIRDALTIIAFLLGIAFFGIGEDGDLLRGIIAGGFFAFWLHFGRSMEKRRSK